MTRLSTLTLTLLIFTTKETHVLAWVPKQIDLILNKQQSTEADGAPWKTVEKQVSKLVTTAALLTATTFCAPQLPYTEGVTSYLTPPAAVAKEMASGSGSRVNKDPESLLRYGLPINNKQVRPFAFECPPESRS